MAWSAALLSRFLGSGRPQVQQQQVDQLQFLARSSKRTETLPRSSAVQQNLNSYWEGEYGGFQKYRRRRGLRRTAAPKPPKGVHKVGVLYHISKE